MKIKQIDEKFFERKIAVEWNKTNKDLGLDYRKKAYCFGAYEKNKIVGYLEFHIISGLGYLNDAVVQREYHGRGYGTKLLNFFIKFCVKKKCHKLSLITSEKNKAAIKLYKKLGFKVEATHLKDRAKITWYTFAKFI